MIKIKEILNDILNDIVRYTYGADCNPKYYKFYVEISDKNCKSKNGHCEYANPCNKIVIFNTYREDESIIKTTIHELAHHIDYCNRGISGHDNPFYEVYAELLHKAMDMKLFNKEKFFDSEVDSRDRKKVERILESYEPNYIDYKNEKKIISVYNSFKHKEYLRNHGYKYNANMKCWEKEVENVEDEYENLKELDGVEIKSGDATELHFNGKIKITAEGNTYPYKEELKNAGFRYGNKKWIYEAVDKDDARCIMNLFQSNTEITLKADKIWL